MTKIQVKYGKKKLDGNGYLCIGPFCWLTIKTLGLIGIYFAFSIGITFYQRWVLQELHFPLSMVVCHLCVKFILAGICRSVWQCFTSQERVVLDWSPYVKKVGPTGIASGLDVGFSNWGLNLITVSLYTMTKSTVIIFILGFALLFKLEKKSWTLIFIVGMISGGLFLFTYEATEFNMKGFLLVLAASFSSGLRWTLAQLVMQKSKLGLSNPLDMVYHVQPWMIVSVLPFAVAFEGKLVATSCQVFRYYDVHVVLRTVWKVLFGSVVAFLMENAEFLVVSQTSSLTLSVAGICKEVITLVLAVEWAGDQMSFQKLIGLILCLGGISFHSFRKALATRQANLQSTLDVQSINSIEKLKLQSAGSEVRVPLLGGDLRESSAKFLPYQLSSSEGESDEDSSNILFNILQ
ncbi:solute carrier family 35 member C2 [Anabrus simplex]|uniref:solute carrier family 35 member C2 n=1 Tax=Anabrus simplex TaxID=316456 RepID=UPI0035A38F86